MLDEYDDDDDARDFEPDWDDEASECLDCPLCGEAIYEDAEQCPSCGAYVTFGGGLWSGRSRLWVILGVAGIVAVVLTFLFGH